MRSKTCVREMWAYLGGGLYAEGLIGREIRKSMF